ncbi:hypothetical protein JCM11641_003645 [Rhodosporidiobolus odoratus]
MTANAVKRNFADATAAVTAAAQAPASASAPSSTASTVTSSATGDFNNGTYWGDGSAGFSGSWVTWVSLIIVAGVILALLFSRYFYIRRAYSGARPTVRSYFLPSKGLHIPLFNLHIRGPPQRIPREAPPSYYATTGRRRRRRHRQTVGETLGAGGARIGQRDQDDGWDDEAAIEGPGPMLPQYFVDIALPAYAGGDGTAAEEAERIRAQNLVTAAGGGGEALPSATEYEAHSRAARDTVVGAAGEAGQPPTYPPVAHLASASASPIPPPPPSRPTPSRSATARSSILSSLPLALPSFRRSASNSPINPVAASSATTPTTATVPRASSSRDTLDGDDGSFAGSDETVPEGGRSRRLSSAASESTKDTMIESGKDGEMEPERRKGEREVAGSSRTSVYKLDGEEGVAGKDE